MIMMMMLAIRQLSLSPLLLLLVLVVNGVVVIEGFTTPRARGAVFSGRTTAVMTRSQQQQHQLQVSITSTGEDDKSSPASSSSSNEGDDDKNDAVEAETEAASSPPLSSSSFKYEPVFDFSDPDQNAVSKFDRIDDAVMGGISLSGMRQSSPGEYASWSGVCRTDGGGFCGTRTLPFQDGTPLNVGQGDGFYLKVRLASDNEPERRVWKLTTRVENVQRSEQLYQAMFEIPKEEEGVAVATNDDDDQQPPSKEWKTIRVPFESFVQVRGPRIVENGPPLNVTGGLFQVGMTLSKFQIAANTTEFFNFRPGYFELQIQEIGVYSSSSSENNKETEAVAVATTATATATKIDTPLTLTKEEAKKKRPAALKILSPLAKLFFNEKRNRRKSATKILQKRGLSQAAIIKFGFQRKANANGIIVACAQFLGDMVSTATRFVLFWTLRIALFYPFKAIRQTLKGLKKEDGNKKATTSTTNDEKLKNPQSPMA